MGFADEMAEADQLYEETEAAEQKGGTRMPDGRQQAQLTECRVEENEHGWAMVGRFQNDKGSIRKWWSLPPSEAQMEYYKADWEMMGYEGKPSGLEEWCQSEEPIGLMCEIFVQTKPGDTRDYTNVYLNRVLGKTDVKDWGGGESDTSDQFVPAGSSSDDDIPF